MSNMRYPRTAKQSRPALLFSTSSLRHSPSANPLCGARALFVSGALLLLGCGSSSASDTTGTGGAAQAGQTHVGSGGSTNAVAGGSSGSSASGTLGKGGNNGSSGASTGGSSVSGGQGGATNSTGSANGGSANGGNANGGRPGTANGGVSTNGGTSAGGKANGGSTAGGQANGGAATGGKANGGAGGPSAGRGGTGQGGQGVAGAAPGVRIVGRTAPGTKGGTRFQWSGVSIQARFRGTQVSVQLDDGGNQNEFAVIVDGKAMSNLVTSSGKTTYPLATGLANGDHELIVWRRTEAFYNPTEYLGLSDFGANGALLPPAPAPDRRIEIIGDSITCGYGNEGTPGCTGTKPENNYLAYGSVAARQLGADLHTVAWSGIGMYRNYNEAGPSASAMPSRYDSALPTVSGSTWDFSRFMPQVVVINLGTNDFSTRGNPGQPYVDAYVKFVQHVRSVYPQAYVLCLVPVPEATAAINQVVTTIKSGGDTKVGAFDANVATGGFGCDGHPDIAKHAAMGTKLAAEIQRVMNW